MAKKTRAKSAQEPAPDAGKIAAGATAAPKDQEAKLDQAIEEWKDHDRSNLKSALEIGALLLGIKASFKGSKLGAWGEWLGKKAEACGVDMRTLQRAMQLARYSKKGKLKDVAGLQAAYDKIAELRKRKKGKANGQAEFEKAELSAGKMSAPSLAQKITELAKGKKDKDLRTIEIQVANTARLRAAINKVLNEGADTLLKQGAVFLIKAAAQAEEKPVAKGDEK